MAWFLLPILSCFSQVYRCSKEFAREPTVSSIYVESFTDKYLPEVVSLKESSLILHLCTNTNKPRHSDLLQITICPPSNWEQMLKSNELRKHNLVYPRDFLGVQRGGDLDKKVFNWRSRNGTLSAEDVQDLVLCNFLDIFSSSIFCLIFQFKRIDNYL